MTTRRHRFRWAAILASLALLLVSFGLQGVGSAGAAPTQAGDDCWQVVPQNLLCWNQYYPTGTVSQLNLFVSDDVQQVWSYHTDINITAAINAWSNAQGPQLLSFTHGSHEQAYKYIANSSNQDNLGSGTFGQTWYCFIDGHCYNTSLPANEHLLDHVNTFINTDSADQYWIGSLDDSCLWHTYMHEAGHALELAHSSNSSDLMYASTGLTNCNHAVSNADLGDFSGGTWKTPCTNPGGDSGETAGISCVYEWQMF